MTETVGARLKRAREERHLTIQQVAEITRVRPHYLEALERGDLSAIPSTAQARGFLRIYAGFLGLTPDELVPAARPSETQPVSQPPAPPVDPSTAAVEAASAPASKEAAKPRPGFLSGLRQRFTRRSDAPAAASQPAASKPESVQPAAPEPDAFVPVRSREELPAPAASIVERTTPQAGPKATDAPIKQKRPSDKKPAPQGRTTKKPVLKTGSSSQFDVDRRTTLKKKVK